MQRSLDLTIQPLGDHLNPPLPAAATSPVCSRPTAADLLPKTQGKTPPAAKGFAAGFEPRRHRPAPGQASSSADARLSSPPDGDPRPTAAPPATTAQRPAGHRRASARAASGPAPTFLAQAAVAERQLGEGRRAGQQPAQRAARLQREALRRQVQAAAARRPAELPQPPQHGLLRRRAQPRVGPPELLHGRGR